MITGEVKIMSQTEIPIERIAELCDRWQITEFALFGSVLRDDFRPDSDIDVLSALPPPPNGDSRKPCKSVMNSERYSAVPLTCW
jgi:predicted nucleotidyltransferase